MKLEGGQALLIKRRTDKAYQKRPNSIEFGFIWCALMAINLGGIKMISKCDNNYLIKANSSSWDAINSIFHYNERQD